MIGPSICIRGMLWANARRTQCHYGENKPGTSGLLGTHLTCLYRDERPGTNTGPSTYWEPQTSTWPSPEVNGHLARETHAPCQALRYARQSPQKQKSYLSVLRVRDATARQLLLQRVDRRKAPIEQEHPARALSQVHALGSAQAAACVLNPS